MPDHLNEEEALAAAQAAIERAKGKSWMIVVFHETEPDSPSETKIINHITTYNYNIRDWFGLTIEGLADHLRGMMSRKPTSPLPMAPKFIEDPSEDHSMAPEPVQLDEEGSQERTSNYSAQPPAQQTSQEPESGT